MTKRKFRFSIFKANEKTIEVPPNEEGKNVNTNIEDYILGDDQTEIPVGDAVLKDGKIITVDGKTLTLTEEEIKAIAAYEYSGAARENAAIEKIHRLANKQSEQEL